MIGDRCPGNVIVDRALLVLQTHDHMRSPNILPMSAFAAIMALTACNKDEVHYGGPSTTSDHALAIVEQARVAATQAFSVNAAQGGSFISDQGTVITIAPNAFIGQDGGTVVGQVDIELIEAMDVGDMVRLNLQTVAMGTGGDKVLLQSGGELRLRAEQFGEQVTVAPGMAQLHIPAGEPDPLMRRFIGAEVENGNVLWQDDGELVLDSLVFLGEDTVGGGGWLQGDYYTTPWPSQGSGGTWPDYGYINCDHPLPPGGDSTDVTITVPQQFSNWGCTVWIVVPEIDCMVYMEAWNGNVVRAGFPLRIGLQGTIVAFSEQGGQYQASFTPITITDDHQQTITLQATSLQAYQSALDAL